MRAPLVALAVVAAALGPARAETAARDRTGGGEDGWLPEIQLGLGVDIRSLGGSSVAFERLHHLAETVGHPRAQHQAGLEEAGPSARATALTLRISGDVARNLYTGLETSVGVASLTDPALDRGGLQVNGGGFYAAGLILGAATGPGPLTVRGELFAGLRGLHLSVTAPRTGSALELSSDAVMPALEPRLAAEIRLGSVALGGRVGRDLFARRDLLVGLYLQLLTGA